MNNPEWGAMFFDEAVKQGAKMFWGARGAIRYNNIRHKRELELYPDRQSFTADDTTDKADFVSFINDEAIPRMEELVRKHDAEHILTISKKPLAAFKCVAEEHGGYLYIGAWA